MELLLLAKLSFKRQINGFRKGKLSAVLSFIFFAYFISVLLFAGITLSLLLNVEVLNYLICGYFIFDFMLRLSFQRVYGSTFEVAFLPVRKSSLVHFFLIGNIFNIFNLAPILLFTPIFIKQLIDPISHLLLLTIAILFINWSILFLKTTNSLGAKAILTIVLLGLQSTIFAWSLKAMDTLGPRKGWILIIGILLSAALYYFIFIFTKKNLLRLRDGFKSRKFLLGRIGWVEDLLALEIKLILRNKRALTYILFSPILVFSFEYIVGFHGSDLTYLGVLFFSAISIMIPLFYAQYLFSWESEYFGFILSNTRSADYISAKHSLLTILILLNGVCLTPIFFYDFSNYYYLIIVLFHIGWSPLLIVAISLNNNRPLKLSKGAFLNYEGTSLITFILILLVPVVPLVVYLPFYWLDNSKAGMYFMVSISMAALFLRRKLIGFTIRFFGNKKYLMYSGFKLS